MPRAARQLARGVGAVPTVSLASSFSPSAALVRTLSTSPSALYPAAPRSFRLPENYVPPTQPPSARPPETRKSQIIRTYTSLLRSTPIIIFFQHNNLTAVEWAAVRRELSVALKAVGPVDVGGADGKEVDLSSHVKLQVLRGRMFNVAMRIVEFHDPKGVSEDTTYNHDLSRVAYQAIKSAEEARDPNSIHATMEPLLSGPIAALCLPAVLPAYLAAALSVLAPGPASPAPTRRARPSYYELETQNALAKLMLVGGRIEGKPFDHQGVAWVGGIKGGLAGLRAQVVHLLQSAGLGLSTTLEGAGKALYVSLESHRQNLEPKKEETVEDGKEENKE
ncbi:54S ribosomal protein L11 mitochondrial [Ceratocystis platani]|uniref:54S ribosomal protein L11 mitochondrial n=1 Tax=Ceratocystis fimbriata f. sp. platani TaxID=88771 RepID=A0A0F8B3R5_CERFI|nr:54S ribosomal protein L11 mitochondrial [Ceratocystis platani]